MNTTNLPAIEINPATSSKASVIWLHGLGADGHDFAPIVEQLGLPAEFGVRFVFPHAPERPVTINRGYVMRAWYDIISMEMDNHADLAGIEESVAAVNALVDKEMQRGVPASKIILAGFSQGGVIALEAAARYPQPLAGVLALSTYLATGQGYPRADYPLPIFMAHGTFDNVVPYTLGVSSRRILESKGYSVTWREYSMLHSVCNEEIADISRWLKDILQPVAG